MISYIFASSFVTCFCVYYNNLNKSYSNVNISANIESILEEENYIRLELRKVKVKENDKVRIKNFKSILYIYKTSDKFEVGDNISLVGDLTKYDLFDVRQLSNFVDKNYYKIKTDEVVIEDNSKLLSDGFKLKCYNTLVKNMNEENAELCYASLFGDKTKLESDIYSSFSAIGVAHLLAVSGLHVGLVAAIVSYILSFIKHKNILKLSIITLILFIYAYLCGFSASVTRAVVMAIILYVAKLYEYKYDALNSLSLAFIFCFIFLNPLSLFTIGFQLSFLCVLGLITLSSSVLKLLFKRKPYNKRSKIAPPREPKIIKALASSISVNFIIFPICISTFHQISIFTVFINLFFIPLFSISFTIMFICLLISIILPFLKFILIIPNIFFQILKVTAEFIANIRVGTLNIFDCGFITMFAILILCFLIKYIVIDKNKKRMLSLFMFVLIIVSFISYNIPNNYKNNMFLINDNKNISILLSDNDSQVGLIGLSEEYSNVQEASINLKIKEIDYVIAYNYTLKHDLYINELVYNFKNIKIYLPDKYLNNPNFQKYKDNFYSIEDFPDVKFEIKNIYDLNGNIISLNFNYNLKNYLLINNELNISNINYVFSALDKRIDTLITNNYNYDIKNYYQYEIKQILYGSIGDNIVTSDNCIQVLSTQLFTFKL